MPSRAGLLCLLAGAVVAIYEDSIGVNDRVVTHIGPPVIAARAGKSVVVATSAGTVAALGLRSGVAAWRRVLGDEEELLDAVASARSLVVTLSHSPAAPDLLTLRAWSQAEGAMQWETVLTAPSAPSPPTLRLTRSNSLLVVTSGSVSQVDASSGALRTQHNATAPGSAAAVLLDAVQLTGEGGTVWVRAASSSTSAPFAFELVRDGAVLASAPLGGPDDADEEGGESLPPTIAHAAAIVAEHGSSHATALVVSRNRSGVVLLCESGGVAFVEAGALLLGGTPAAALRISSLHRVRDDAASGAAVIVALGLSDGSVVHAALQFREPGADAAVEGLGEPEEAVAAAEMEIDPATGEARPAAKKPAASKKKKAAAAAAKKQQQQSGSCALRLQTIHASSPGAPLPPFSSTASAAFFFPPPPAAGAAAAASQGAAGQRYLLAIASAVVTVPSPAPHGQHPTPGAPSAALEVQVFDSADGSPVGAKRSFTLPRFFGGLARAIALPFAARGAADAPSSPSSSSSNLVGLTLLLVSDGGTTALVGDDGAVAWISQEGDACPAQALVVDALPLGGSSKVSKSVIAAESASSASAPAAHADDPALGLASRWAAQAEELSRALPAACASASRAVAAFLADPLAQVLRAGGLGGRTHGAGARGPISPSAVSELEKLLLLRSRVDGGGGRGGVPLGSGTITALQFESGEERWRVGTPLSASAAALVGAEAPGGRALRPLVTSYEVSMVLSRPRPLQSHNAEVMVVETLALDAPFVQPPPEGSGPEEEGATFPTTHLTFVTWLDAESGAVTGSLEPFSSPAPLLRLVRTPVLHGPTHREVYALLFADGAALVAPGDQGVHSSLLTLGPGFVLSGVETDERGGEALGGRVLDPGPTPQRSGEHDAHVASLLRRRLPAAAVGGGSVKERGPSVPSFESGTTPVWRAVLTTAPGGALGAAHVLAVVHGGSGVAAGAPLLSPLDEEGGAIGGRGSKSERMVGAALAAAGMEAEGPGALPAQILGDDSLLLKFLSPHLVAVVTGPSGPVLAAGERAARHAGQRTMAFHAAAASAAGGGRPQPRGGDAPAAPTAAGLTLTLVDGVTGHVVAVRQYPGASGPVSLVRHEHWVVFSYWNARLRRPEVASLALYEGAMEKYELTPWNRGALASLAHGPQSAFGADSPVIVHRSYVLPVTVKELAVTRTREGMTTPLFLLSTTAGGVLPMHRRALDPRRPTGEPSAEEKMEGLTQYSPVLPLFPASLLTYNVTVPRARIMLSSPTAFESTTLVALLGLDHFFVRTAPAKQFDQLDPDYNAFVFTAVLGIAAVAAAVVARSAKDKELSMAWR